MIAVGQHVRVRRVQPSHTGPAQYPGRVGVVVAENACGIARCGGLWYVDLEPTARAKQRRICIYGDNLEVLA